MSDEARKRLAGRLKDAREASGISQEEVAASLGLPRPAISQIENGHRRVEALELARLAKLYQLPLSHFSDESDASSTRMDALHRTAQALSEKDREEVLHFAEFLRERANQMERQR